MDPPIMNFLYKGVPAVWVLVPKYTWVYQYSTCKKYGPQCMSAACKRTSMKKIHRGGDLSDRSVVKTCSNRKYTRNAPVVRRKQRRVGVIPAHEVQNVWL